MPASSSRRWRANKSNIAANKPETDENNDCDNDKDGNACKPEAMIPEGLLPSYLAEAFSDLYGEDGLMVFGRGLGWLSLLAVFVRFYGDVEEGHVAVTTTTTTSSKAASIKSKFDWLYFVCGLARRNGNAWLTPSLLCHF